MESRLNDTRAIPGCPWTFANDMRKMVDNKEFSNIKFVVGSSRVKIYGNSCILSARSQVFKAMFENEDGLHAACLDDPILLPDISPDTFLCLLEFLYTNCCTLNEKNVVDVLASAAEYSLDELQRICGQFMADSLTISTACAAMQSSDPVIRRCEFEGATFLVDFSNVSVMYDLPDLKGTVLGFIEKHAEQVFKTEGFHEMSEEALGTLIASHNLNIDEVDLIGFVREWATVNSVALGKPVKELTKNIIRHIRLLLLSPEELSLVETENEKDSLIPVKLISDAWRYHALKSSAPQRVPVPRSGTKIRPS